MPELDLFHHGGSLSPQDEICPTNLFESLSVMPAPAFASVTVRISEALLGL
jgi:hypothetical protein